MTTSDSRSRPRTRLAPHLQQVPPSGIRDFFEIVASRREVISLGIGEPDFVTPWRIRDAAIYALGRGATSYTANAGLLSLREQISGYLHRAFGVDYRAEDEILVTVGVSEALDLAIRALVAPGDEVVYHEPCYVSYAPVITFAHGVAVPVTTRREEGFRLTRAEVEAVLTPRSKVLLLNFPTNPTGAVLDEADLAGLAALAVERDLLVIADDIYAELSYEAPHRSIAALPGMKERTILLHGLSKAWAMTGFRLGYACGPADLIAGLMKIHQYTMLCAPILSQEAAVEALTQPERDIDEMRADYRRRRNWICEALNAMGLPCHKPRGAFYAFPQVGHLGMTSKAFALALLHEENVACVPGDAFGGGGEGFLRCSYATDLALIREAMVRMERFVARRRSAVGGEAMQAEDWV
ncbi:MAG: aminotransferase class I/II-fold pyridoxal phosphate-dependent enzyme [Candidatus Competibacterales bacterium]